MGSFSSKTQRFNMVCYQKLIKSNPLDLIYVPTKYKTRELCMMAFKMNWEVIEFFPQSYITKELAMEAVKNDVKALIYIPERFYTFELLSFAIEVNPLAIRYIPISKFHPQILIKAVSITGFILKFIPKECQFEKLIEVALAQNPKAKKYAKIPFKVPNYDLYTDGCSDDCTICLSKVTNEYYQTNCCHHKFHIFCLDEWKKISNTCPLCRSSLMKLTNLENETILI